jgi:hypothetical protein
LKWPTEEYPFQTKNCNTFLTLTIVIVLNYYDYPPHTEMHPLRAMVLIPNKPPPTLADPSKWSPELNDFIAKCCIKGNYTALVPFIPIITLAFRIYEETKCPRSAHGKFLDVYQQSCIHINLTVLLAPIHYESKRPQHCVEATHR